MKFDTVIIGGGLAGLVSGIKLCQQNKRCAIISAGQSALHFCSGSFDLLNKLPDGTKVTSPLEAIGQLIEQNPNHPYSKLGEEEFKIYTKEAEEFLKSLEIPFNGSTTNHYRITPLGELKPTWQTIDSFATTQTKDKLPWKEVSVFNLTGFLDFYPDFIAHSLAKLGTKSNVEEFNLESVDRLRRNPSELRSTNITNVMDKLSQEELNSLIAQLKKGSKTSEAILFPAILGLENEQQLKVIEKEVGKPIYIIPTLPPSVIGIKLQQYLHNRFIKLGGTYMLGDNVIKGEIENNSVTKVYSLNHGNIPFRADHFVLASGSFFSQGLIANRSTVYEPIFNLDVYSADKREDWYNENVFNDQPYQNFGIKTNPEFKGLINNKPLNNLYVIGAGLENFNPIKEGSGAGVSLLTALKVAHTIQSKK